MGSRNPVFELAVRFSNPWRRFPNLQYVCKSKWFNFASEKAAVRPVEGLRSCLKFFQKFFVTPFRHISAIFIVK